MSFAVWLYGVTIYLCKHNIKPVLANIQRCTPFVNKQFAPCLHGDLMIW